MAAVKSVWMRHLCWSLAILGCDTQHSPSRTLASSWTCTLFCLLLNTGPHTHTQNQTKTSCHHTGLLARAAQLFSRKCHILLIQKTSNIFFLNKLSTSSHLNLLYTWCLVRDGQKKYIFNCAAEEGRWRCLKESWQFVPRQIARRWMLKEEGRNCTLTKCTYTPSPSVCNDLYLDPLLLLAAFTHLLWSHM